MSDTTTKTKLSPMPLVHAPTELSNCTFGGYTEIGTMCYLENVQMGDYSYCGPFCFMQNADIGKFANIAASVRLGPTSHPMERPTQHHFTYRRAMYGFAEKDDEAFFVERASRRTRLGHDTWIGHGAIIMPGITVGDGAVVGAGAIVTHDVPPYSIVVGVPARITGRRFPEQTAERLSAIAWWNWDHDTLRSRLADFCGDTEAFVAKYGASL